MAIEKLLKKRFVLVYLMLICVGVICDGVIADIIIKPLDEYTAASGYYAETYAPVHTTDGSGLSSALNTGDVIPTVWPTASEYENGTMWLSDLGPIGDGKWLSFNLGDEYEINSMYVWNHPGFSEDGEYGAKDVTLQYKNALGEWVDAEQLVFLQKSDREVTGAMYDLTTSITAQEIRFWITSNYSQTYPDRIAIAEVRFIGNVVPEPATMLLLGVGGLGCATFRKR